jgi:hypothetical protein
MLVRCFQIVGICGDVLRRVSHADETVSFVISVRSDFAILVSHLGAAPRESLSKADRGGVRIVMPVRRFPADDKTSHFGAENDRQLGAVRTTGKVASNKVVLITSFANLPKLPHASTVSLAGLFGYGHVLMTA